MYLYFIQGNLACSFLLINEQISNTEFTVSKFANLMFLSRVQLHRRLKAEIGMSASEMIRWVRLTHAANLFKTTELNVTQVSHEADSIICLISPPVFATDLVSIHLILESQVEFDLQG